MQGHSTQRVQWLAEHVRRYQDDSPGGDPEAARAVGIMVAADNRTRRDVTATIQNCPVDIALWSDVYIG